MRLILFICLNFCLLPATALAAARVVTSIAPLQEITTELMRGVTSPQSIITDGASAHHFAFRPSHMRLLQQADLVIWIDSNFEPRRVGEIERLIGDGACTANVSEPMPYLPGHPDFADTIRIRYVILVKPSLGTSG